MSQNSARRFRVRHIVPELEPRPDHASYIASWLSVLKNEKRFLFSAAAHAQRAVAHLHDLQPMAHNVRLEPRAIDAGNRRICLKATLFGDVTDIMHRAKHESGLYLRTGNWLN
jgi:hypothetical protein